MDKTNPHKSRKRMVRKFDFPTVYSVLADAGLNSADAKSLASILLKQYASNGPEWIVKRVKAHREWYLTYLAGKPQPPEWIGHTKRNLPKSTWRKVFDLPLEGALLALSVDTLIEPATEVTQEQLDKFKHGLEGNGVDKFYARYVAKELGKKFPHSAKSKHTFMPLTMPTQNCITGNSIPIGGDKEFHIPSRARTPEQRLPYQMKAYLLSNKSIPSETVEFLMDAGHFDWLPHEAIGNEWQLELNTKPDKSVGRISFLQQSEFKLRTVANPHRISQHYLDPLFTMWREESMRLPCNTTFSKEEGVQWVQDQLSQGVTLAGVDMTSATDLLDLDACLDLVNHCYFNDLLGSELYTLYLDYFKSLSRGKWWSEDLHEFVSWKQGQPLGLTPSFMLLDLTNHALGESACAIAGIPITSFRNHGDDMIIDARAAEAYMRLVRTLGGEINESKTLTSDRMAEFDGMIITAHKALNKRIYLDSFDDDSFFDYVKWMGPKGVKYLKPRQRKVYEELKFVPGVIHGGMYSTDSHGESLALREEWWLTVRRELLHPDRELDSSVGESLQKLMYSLDLTESEADMLLPWSFSDRDYQSRDLFREFTGDPRKWSQDGSSILQIMESWIKDPSWIPYTEFAKSVN